MATPVASPRPPAGRCGRRLQRRTALARRNRLVESHRELVRPLAVHYGRCTPEPVEDLIQVGLMGLIRAAELFDTSQGTPFEAFARPHIRGAILHHLRDCAQAVRLPRRQAELLEKLLRLQRQHELDGHAGELNRRLEALGLDGTQAALLLRQRRLNRPLALLAEHEELLDASALPGAEATEDGDPLLPEGGAAPLLARLPERERLVVEQVVLAGLSYRELARRLEVSPMTVQRLLRRGLDQLRDQLGLGCRPFSSADWGCRGRSAAPAC